MNTIQASCRYIEERLNHTMNREYEILYCPDNSWKVGAGFDKASVYKTLKLGYFPIGTVFRRTKEMLAVGKKSNGDYKLSLLGKMEGCDDV